MSEARLLLIGPPGAGKGTQAHALSDALGVPAISTGDIFRDNVRNETELGRQAKAYMDAGDNVPDSLTNDLVRDRLGQDDCAGGFLLDGYPRTTDQVRALDEFLAGQGASMDAVIELVADPDIVVERLRKRALDQGRADDDESVVRHRLTVLVLEKLLWIPDSEDPDQTEYDRGRYHQQDPSKYNFPDHFTAFNVWGAGGAMRLS